MMKYIVNMIIRANIVMFISILLNELRTATGIVNFFYININYLELRIFINP